MNIAPKYAAEVERLKGADADTLDLSWASVEPLFQYCTPTGHKQERPDGKYCGCLTLVRSGSNAWTDRLTRAIKKDTRVPDSADDLTETAPNSPERLAALLACAEWQTRLDAEIRGGAKMETT